MMAVKFSFRFAAFWKAGEAHFLECFLADFLAFLGFWAAATGFCSATFLASGFLSSLGAASLAGLAAF